MKPSQFFTEEQKKNITDAVKEAELNTSGEIRVHIEKSSKIDHIDRAIEVFHYLKMV